PAAVDRASRGRPRRQPGCVLEGVPESAQARRSGAIRRMAVPHRTQRSVLIVAAPAARKRAAGGSRCVLYWRAIVAIARRAIVTNGAVARGRARPRSAVRRSARSGPAEGLSRIQVRRDSGSAGLSRVDREVAAIYRARFV